MLSFCGFLGMNFWVLGFLLFFKIFGCVYTRMYNDLILIWLMDFV